MNINYISFSKIVSKTANSIQVCKMSEAFSSIGHKVTLYSRFGNISEDPYLYYGLKKSFKIIRFKSSEKKLSWLIYTAKVVFKVLRNPPDLLYFRDSFSALIFALIGYKVIFESHSIAFGRDKFIYKFLFNNKNLTMIVSISYELKKLLIDKYNIDEHKVLVAHDGVNPIKSNKLSKKDNIRFW